MYRLLALLFALSAVLFPAASAAEGPGTRIRSGSQIPRVPPHTAPPTKEDACARPRLDGSLCIEHERPQTRRPVQTGNAPGPESVGGTSGAGSSASSGTTGAGSLGAGAPR